MSCISVKLGKVKEESDRDKYSLEKKESKKQDKTVVQKGAARGEYSQGPGHDGKRGQATGRCLAVLA